MNFEGILVAGMYDSGFAEGWIPSGDYNLGTVHRVSSVSL